MLTQLLAVAEGFCLSLVFAVPLAAQDLIRPDSPNGALAQKKLEQARIRDQLNSQSWTADNEQLDHFYERKADQVEALLEQLNSGRPVSSTEVNKALDNSEAQQY